MKTKKKQTKGITKEIKEKYPITLQAVMRKFKILPRHKDFFTDMHQPDFTTEKFNRYESFPELMDISAIYTNNDRECKIKSFYQTKEKDTVVFRGTLEDCKTNIKAFCNAWWSFKKGRELEFFKK